MYQLYFISVFPMATKWAFGNSGNGKQKWKTEVKMKIIYCLVHTSLKRPPVKQDH